MDVIYQRCAAWSRRKVCAAARPCIPGIDVHKKVIVVALRIGAKTEIRQFGTLTHELRGDLPCSFTC